MMRTRRAAGALAALAVARGSVVFGVGHALAKDTGWDRKSAKKSGRDTGWD